MREVPQYLFTGTFSRPDTPLQGPLLTPRTKECVVLSMGDAGTCIESKTIAIFGRWLGCPPSSFGCKVVPRDFGWKFPTWVTAGPITLHYIVQIA